ncbi:MAG TPA: DUF4013 domain-containing protein [Candidatus Binatia bacterium]|nr:DUF4013 domain-containing protein [Candidatus Binatia bacterium]
MDFGKAFTFFTQDPNWISKFAIGALIVLISPFLLGIPIVLLVGFQLAQARLVIQGEQDRLPAWDNLGALFMDGLNLSIALLVYSSPVLLLFCIGFAATLLPALASDSDQVAGALAGVSIGIWALLLCLLILLSLALAFLTPALNVQYVRHGTLGSLLRFGEVLELTRNNLGDIALAWLALLVANIVLQLVVSISAITICGPFILGLAGPVWFLAAAGHLYGQIATKSEKGMGAKPAF